jgi:hypothetical protein
LFDSNRVSLGIAGRRPKSFLFVNPREGAQLLSPEVAFRRTVSSQVTPLVTPPVLPAGVTSSVRNARAESSRSLDTTRQAVGREIGPIDLGWLPGPRFIAASPSAPAVLIR